ncbi:MAG: ribose-5-phosphate isomerase RpiA [Deltaproteobacteria bacterium]|nr:ribose-5-phosphate isomerase RpiA [Deltaproteobacteria bacterium]
MATQPADLDRIAAAALGLVGADMLLGLGTGRAAEAFIRGLGERVRQGLRVRGVPTSRRSEALARSVGIEVTSLDEVDGLDVAFDGADEVTPHLDLTKGLGGALLRERVVANAAETFVVLVTPEKLVEKLNSRGPIPIEIVAFARAPIVRGLAALGGRPTLRVDQAGTTYFTDNGNPIVDTDFGPISDPAGLDSAIRKIPGVVDTGMFLSMADVVFVGDADRIRELRRR